MHVTCWKRWLGRFCARAQNRAGARSASRPRRIAGERRPVATRAGARKPGRQRAPPRRGHHPARGGAENGTVALRVSDEGTGFPPQLPPRCLRALQPHGRGSRPWVDRARARNRGRHRARPRRACRRPPTDPAAARRSRSRCRTRPKRRSRVRPGEGPARAPIFGLERGQGPYGPTPRRLRRPFRPSARPGPYGPSTPDNSGSAAVSA